MLHSATPAKILVGIPLDADYSHELLSWAIRVLARTNDTIVALHVIEPAKSKKLASKTKDCTLFRRAKAFVISAVGEFSKLCRSKQVNLEAKVAFSSSVGNGLVEEAILISAAFLLVRGTNRSNRLDNCIVKSIASVSKVKHMLLTIFSPLKRITAHETVRYCFEHAPESCAVISVGKLGRQRDFSEASVPHSKEFRQSSRRAEKELPSDKSDASAKSLIILKTKREGSSPKTVLDGLDTESRSTEEDASSLGNSSSTDSSTVQVKLRGESNRRRQASVLKFFTSFLQSPFDKKGRKRKESFEEENQKALLRCFSYNEISNATNNFHPENLVGLGGYSEVFRGNLCDGHSIAVKRLAKENTEKEFLIELGILGHVCHPNTAKLIGCCIENGHHLIFNFCPNGNLASALHGETCKLLDWPSRYKIAVGVARGLHYLHTCCKHKIIHRDIKASNVLLGKDYEPQITDFGLAKWLPNKWTHHAVIPIEGTFGYLAPEYFMHGIVDEKTDVYSFGVLLLEIVTGRRPVCSTELNLLYWAKPLMECGKIDELADPRLGGDYDIHQMQRLVVAASYCIRQSSVWRPVITQVLDLLTTGHDSEAARGWEMPMHTDDEMDDYSIALESDVSTTTDITLDDEL